MGKKHGFWIIGIIVSLTISGCSSNLNFGDSYSNNISFGEIVMKCQQEINECSDISNAKYNVRINVERIEKFDDVALANDFFNIWKGFSQIDLESTYTFYEYPVEFDETDFPLVLAFVKLVGSNGQTPLVAICDSDGKLIKKSKSELLCG
jgi:hypothetical protein